MIVRGYKCFNKDFTNRYGVKFEVGKIYIADSQVKSGLNGKKYRLCKNLEDTFRYFDAVNYDIKICEVIGSGNVVTYIDEYYGYYDMYAVEKIKIKKELIHEEIISYGLNLNPTSVKRFIQGFKLMEEEIIMFKEKFKNEQSVLDTIAYYKENNKEVYKKGYYG